MNAQIDALSTKLTKLCQSYKISERAGELYDENWDDYDSTTAEAIVNALNNVDMELATISYHLNHLSNQ